MMPLDNIIAQMIETECKDCNCTVATSDHNQQDCIEGQEVEIYGSFCYPLAGHTHIAIIVRDRQSKQEVWSRVCDTGHMCSIPFTSEEGFICG